MIISFIYSEHLELCERRPASFLICLRHILKRKIIIRIFLGEREIVLWGNILLCAVK